MPIDIAVVAAVLVLLLGVIGSLVPAIPGAALSVVGVVMYWWSTGFSTPGTLFVASVTIIGLGAVLLDYVAGAVSAKAGGASNLATAVAAVVGFLLFFAAGPIGIVVGVGVTVFAVELLRTADTAESAAAALYATVGLLASTVIQFLITLTILVAFIAAVIV